MSDLAAANIPRDIPITRKELACALGRSPGYVSAMRKAGLSPRASVTEAVKWLKANPGFACGKAYNGDFVNTCEHL